MDMPVIRSALPSDTGDIYCALKKNDNEQGLAHRFTLSESDLFLALFSKNSFAEALVAKNNNKIAGFALFSPTNRNFNLFISPGIYIHCIYVEPEVRRQGIGRKFIDKIRETGKERNCCRIDWVLLKDNALGNLFFKSVEDAKTVDYIEYKRITL